MISCPNCHQSVEILDKHLGTLFTCPHCAAVYFINWDGQAEMAQHEEEPPAPTQYSTVIPTEQTPEQTAYEAPASEGYDAGQGFDANQGYQAEQNYESNQGYETEQGYQADQSYEANQGYESNENFGLTPVAEEAPAESGFEAPASEQEIPYDFASTLDQQPEEVTPSSGVSDEASFADVLDFANANTSAGPLAYTVTIDGIESSQLLHQLREAMTDSRFGWDVMEILTHVGGGRLVLRGLTPAKASVLINRIKYLPFKISWRQDVLSGS